MAWVSWRVAALGVCLTVGSGAALAQQARTVEFRDVSFGSAEMGVTIGRISVSGLVREGDRVKAQRIDVERVAGRFGEYRIEAPAVAISGFDGHSDLFRALTEGGTAAVDWPRMLQTASADQISIDQMTDRDPTAYLEAVTRGFVLNGLKNGIVASARVAVMDARVTPPSDSEKVSIRVGETSYQGLDIAEWIRFAFGGGSGDARRLLERVTVDGIDINNPVVTVRFDRFELAAIDGRAPSVGMLGPANESLEAKLRRGLTYTSELLRYLKIGRYSMEGMKISVRGEGEFSMGAITFSGFSGRQLDLFEIRNMDFKAAGEGAKLGRFEIEKITYGPLLDYLFGMALNHQADDPTPEKIVEISPRFAAIRLSQAEFNTPTGPISFDAFRFELDDRAGSIPERLASALANLKLDLSKMPPNEGRDKLVSLGYREIVANAKAQLRWQSSDKAIILDNTGLGIDKVGQLDVSMRLGNADLRAAVAKPDSMDEMIQAARFEGLEIRLADLGFAERFFADVAKAAGASPDAIRAGIAAEVKSQAAANLGPALAPGSADALAQFIQSGGRVTMRVTPRDGAALSVAEFAMGPMVIPKLRIAIEAAKN